MTCDMRRDLGPPPPTFLGLKMLWHQVYLWSTSFFRHSGIEKAECPSDRLTMQDGSKKADDGRCKPEVFTFTKGPTPFARWLVALPQSSACDKGLATCS